MQRGMLDELSAIISNSCHPVHSQQSLLSSRLFLPQCTREHVHRLLFSMSIRLFTTALSLSLSILSAIWITNLSYSQNCSQKLRAFAAFITEKKITLQSCIYGITKVSYLLGHLSRGSVDSVVVSCLHVLLVSVWVSSGFSGFLPPPRTCRKVNWLPLCEGGTLHSHHTHLETLINISLNKQESICN